MGAGLGVERDFFADRALAAKRGLTRVLSPFSVWGIRPDGPKTEPPSPENPPRSMPPEDPIPHETPPEKLLELVYDELRRQAARQLLRQGGAMTIQPTELVHEAWMRMSAKDRAHWRGRDHFFATAVLSMRHVLVDRIRRKTASKREGTKVDVSLADEVAEKDAAERILTLDECVERLSKEHPECAKVVQMKFFAGLGNEETARLLGCGLRTVERQWAFARAKLYQMVLEREAPDDKAA